MRPGLFKPLDKIEELKRQAAEVTVSIKQLVHSFENLGKKDQEKAIIEIGEKLDDMDDKIREIKGSGLTTDGLLSKALSEPGMDMQLLIKAEDTFSKYHAPMKPLDSDDFASSGLGEGMSMGARQDTGDMLASMVTASSYAASDRIREAIVEAKRLFSPQETPGYD